MERDVKEVVGVLMRVLGGDETSEEEIADLEFEASGDLLTALTEAYIKLLAFACDREVRSSDRRLDALMRAELQQSLDRIVSLSDQPATSHRQSFA